MNPQIDEQELEDIKNILSVMYKGKRRYTLIPPFARPRVTVGENDNTDHRTIILRQTQR